jgi:oligopeptide transport system substrate-binding protein
MSKEERIKQAKALLARGYGPDKPLTVDILYNTNEGHKKIALAISSMWKHNLGSRRSSTTWSGRPWCRP